MKMPKVNDIFQLVIILCFLSISNAKAATVFIFDRTQWETEAATRGLAFSNESFDSFPDSASIPAFSVGPITFNPGPNSGAVVNGALKNTFGGAVRIGPGPVDATGTIEGDFFGLGFDVNNNADRLIDLYDENGDYLFPQDPPFALGSGFVGVLFGLPREAAGFLVGSDDLLSVDNMVVAHTVPVPAAMWFFVSGLVVLVGTLQPRKNIFWRM